MRLWGSKIETSSLQPRICVSGLPKWLPCVSRASGRLPPSFRRPCGAHICVSGHNSGYFPSLVSVRVIYAPVGSYPGPIHFHAAYMRVLRSRHAILLRICVFGAPGRVILRFLLRHSCTHIYTLISDLSMRLGSSGPATPFPYLLSFLGSESGITPSHVLPSAYIYCLSLDNQKKKSCVPCARSRGHLAACVHIWSSRPGNTSPFNFGLAYMCTS